MGFFAHLLDIYDDWPTWSKHVLIFLSLTAVGTLDYYTGYYLSFSVFYIVPVSLASWGFGKWSGIAAAALSAIIWALVGAYTAFINFGAEVYAWNLLIRFSFLALFASIISEVHDRIDNEEKLADTDALTGLFNTRCFRERLEEELHRARRYNHPISIAYLDLDNFKSVNDVFGHAKGDRVLCIVSEKITATIRKTDLAARLGGDEFAVVLSETGYEGADTAFRKIRNEANEAMEDNGWEVTMSVGALTYDTLPENIGKMIAEADALMYEVKRSGKNNVIHEQRIGSPESGV